jgi:hypothetical protein
MGKQLVNFITCDCESSAPFLAHMTQPKGSPSLAPFGQAVSEEKIFLTLANQKQELPLAAIFVGGIARNEETL